MYLNLARDLVTVTDVLRVVNETIPIEAAVGMTLPDGSLPPIFDDYTTVLKCPVTGMRHVEFKAAGTSASVCLHVATGDTRI